MDREEGLFFIVTFELPFRIEERSTNRYAPNRSTRWAALAWLVIWAFASTPTRVDGIESMDCNAVEKRSMTL